MGVHGLWKLLEPSGQMVPLESLAGKVLAVDVSIWLHQAIKGVHDGHGAPVAVAHLLILFHRLCKLLFYKIKPVFVFDGGVPALKRQTMVARRQRSTAAKSEAIKVREKLIKNLLKHEAVRQMLSDETASAVLGLNSFTLPGPSAEEDLYKLPPIAADYADSESSGAPSSSDEDDERHTEDIHSIDVTSQEFLSLPPEVRHDILTELLETRKQSSWKHLESMPKKSDSFSDFQMNRLLKRHAVQTSLEKAGKEMGGRALSLKELESLLGDQGVLDPKLELPSKRIAQDNVTRYLLINKDSADDSEQGEGEKFDIMDHLQDVEWSSESDTDVIMGRTSNRSKVVNKRDGDLNQAEESQVKKEASSISKQAKVRVTDEIADILSVLEDGDVTNDVKTKLENLQNQLNSCQKLSNSQISETEEATEPEIVEKEEIVKKEIDKKEEIVEGEKLVSSENAQTVGVIEETNKPKEREEESISSVKTAETTDEKAKETLDSSSDSESDFVPITITEMENIQKNEVKSSNEAANESFSGSKSLTVIIKPTDVGEGEDIFADVFKSHPSIVETGVDEKNDEGERADEVIKQYKTEFEQQMSKSDINDLKKTLEEEHVALVKEKGKQERHALNITDHVYSDAQELLRLFGIPYVVAPMEAEAQCATLDAIGLTEGTITDDSDIWLFGGRVVYKNFFNQNKHVLEYRLENIQKYFKLTREDLIRIALLVGSDYTLGLNGVGPVTALEILAAFQAPNQESLEPLKKFRDWFIGTSKSGPLRTTLRKKIKNAVIYPGFPNAAVVQAYLHPQVDDSREPFSWAKPNLELIRDYAKMKLGWSTEKCNELLLPVMKKFDEKTSQPTIEKHFKILQKTPFAEGMLSKRVENAIKRFGGEFIEETTEPVPKRMRKVRKRCEADESKKDGENNGESSQSKPCDDSEGPSKRITLSEASKLKLIKEKLHQNLRVPQREQTQKMLEERKKEAIKIFRTYKKGGKKKTKVYAKEEANLSESSSEDD